jgi:hypothetical protein
MLAAALFTMFLSAAAQEMVIPEGTILPLILNETVTTARLEENEPILFALADDGRGARAISLAGPSWMFGFSKSSLLWAPSMMACPPRWSISER